MHSRIQFSISGLLYITRICGFLCMRHRKPSVPEAASVLVCPSVGGSVRPEKNIAKSQKATRRDFRPILVTDVFGFIDVLIRFWGQKVKEVDAAMLARSWESYNWQHQTMYSADILIPHVCAITLVFWHQQRLVGDAPFRLKFALKVTHLLRKTPTSTDFRL